MMQHLLTRRRWLRQMGGAALVGLGFPWTARADDNSSDVQRAVGRGLDWLVKAQHRDGHWEGSSGQYPTAMTALAGIALLMEGSTLREGKYAPSIRRAVDWFLERSQRNGLLGRTSNPMEAQRYTYGHGFGLLFLACVYGEEEDSDRRRVLEDVLTRAVQFTGKAQCSSGGWGYLAKGCNTEGDDMDEGSTTITQVQALRAARNAGIVVPKSIIDRSRVYLEKCTGERGDVLYRPGRQAITPGLTTAAIACMFNAGEYSAPIVKRWVKYCQQTVSILGAGGSRVGHDEYTHYYYAQALYVLGEDGYARLFPESKPDDRLTWSKYRKPTFDYLLKNQNSDGSWGNAAQSSWSYIGPVYATAVYLTILQLDRGTLPIYQR
jgi:hypothetical protein